MDSWSREYPCQPLVRYQKGSTTICNVTASTNMYFLNFVKVIY